LSPFALAFPAKFLYHIRNTIRFAGWQERMRRSDMKKLGFGMMRLPLTDPKVQGSVDLSRVCAMVDAFLER